MSACSKMLSVLTLGLALIAGSAGALVIFGLVLARKVAAVATGVLGSLIGQIFEGMLTQIYAQMALEIAWACVSLATRGPLGLIEVAARVRVWSGY